MPAGNDFFDRNVFDPFRRNGQRVFGQGREILPNALPPMVVNASLGVGVAILFEAGLSFLGLGDPNVMSWGYMIGSSRVYIRQAWWTVTFPGVAIFISVLSLSLVGDWLNDAFNPKNRGNSRG